MRVAIVVVGGVPNASQSGGALTVWTIAGYLLGEGHDVTVVSVLGDELDDPGATLEQRVDDLRALGADVRLVRSGAWRLYDGMPADARSRLRRAWRPTDEELLPSLLDAGDVAKVVAELAPDVVYAYHWEAVAATRSLAGHVPRLATVVDLPQVSSLYRWRSTPGRLERGGLARLVWLQGRLRHQPRLLVDLLNECEASANLAAHHAAWLRKHGAVGCRYLRTPIEDRAGESWLAERERHRTKERPRLLLIGHLRGVSTQDGLDAFARDVLPRLEAELGPGGFEARLAGGYEAPPHLRDALDRPSVRFLGHVEGADEEFAAADALVVPTSIRLGTRVRILSAFSYGCPVVAHEANALGIPELAHGENVLLGGTAAALADGLLRLLRDPELARRLEAGGRETYERCFAPPVAAARIEETLRDLCASPVPAPAG